MTEYEEMSCRGCCIRGVCSYKHTVKVKECPCIICIVKGMCRGPSCDEFTQFMTTVDKEEDAKWK